MENTLGKGRAYRFDAFGMDNLQQVEIENPKLRRGEIRVQVRAASINYRDLMLIDGLYDPRMPLPLVPLSDGAGEVIEVDPEVTRFQIGDRVMSTFAPKSIAGTPTRDEIRHTRGGPLPGMLQEFVRGDASGFVSVPEHLDFVEAATLPCAALTAWNALEGVRAGDRVLTQGTGGVSIFALQLARALGAEVVITSSSDDKLKKAMELGASAGVNYRETPNWGKAARNVGDRPGGFVRVIEVGGAGTLEESLRAVDIGGEIALIGVLSGAQTKLLLTRVFMNAVTIRGIIVGSRAQFEAMNRAITAAQIHPVVDRVFDFDEAQDAFSYVRSGAHFGKVCIRI